MSSEVVLSVAQNLVFAGCSTSYDPLIRCTHGQGKSDFKNLKNGGTKWQIYL